MIIAPMSSGKSTLINAILGKKLLATSNFACTSKETKIILNKCLLSNRMYIEFKDGKETVFKNVDDESVCQFDYGKSDIESIVIETNGTNQINSSKAVMIIDTPGENYSGNDFHEIETRRSLASFNGKAILYVLNASQIGTEDDYKILSEVKMAAEEKNIRIAFVLNKVDSLDQSREDVKTFMKEVVAKFIEKVGIKNYIVFPCSSEAALLFKNVLNGTPLSENESDKLYKYYKYYYSDSARLKYAVYDSACKDMKGVITYDGECYQKNRIQIALDNTGINEIEKFISVLSTKCKVPKIITKELPV